MLNKWAVGTITPVPKAGISHSMSDCRPISVLPLPSKIIERAVHNQLIYHLESHGLLDKRQHGFRSDHSTCSAIFELCQYLYDSLDNRNSISCVFIDYSKAFDTIDHSILCKKLELYGLSNGVISWCRDYLTDRQQCVKVDDHKSSHRRISYGVPQGSILGPLFFIIYVNDLLDLFKNEDVNILLYADDTVLYCADKNSEVACQKVGRALGEVSKWCNLNKLTINTKKTQHLLVTPNKDVREISSHSIVMGNCVLKNVDMYNYLGVHIDKDKYKIISVSKDAQVYNITYSSHPL